MLPHARGAGGQIRVDLGFPNVASSLGPQWVPTPPLQASSGASC